MAANDSVNGTSHLKQRFKFENKSSSCLVHHPRCRSQFQTCDVTIAFEPTQQWRALQGLVCLTATSCLPASPKAPWHEPLSFSCFSLPSYDYGSSQQASARPAPRRAATDCSPGSGWLSAS